MINSHSGNLKFLPRTCACYTSLPFTTKLTAHHRARSVVPVSKPVLPSRSIENAGFETGAIERALSRYCYYETAPFSIHV